MVMLICGSVFARLVLGDRRAYSQADRGRQRQTGRQTCIQADKQAGNQADLHASGQAGRQAGGQTDIHTGRQTGRQADRQADTQPGREADKQTGKGACRSTDREVYWWSSASLNKSKVCRNVSFDDPEPVAIIEYVGKRVSRNILHYT